MTSNVTTDPVAAAQRALDEHAVQIVQWHFSPETGCPYWLDFAAKADFNPLSDVKCFADIIRLFPHFQDDALRFEPLDRWVPKPYKGRPFCVFETGGTTGMPKQRIGWDDYKIDYEQFSETLDDDAFPRGGHWLMVGPTGPRRLRLAIEHLANYRGSSCMFVDLDPRWVKKLISSKQFDQAKAYMEHVVDQATIILKHRKVTALFTTPKLLEALAEKISLPEAGIKGVFVGGTTMTPQYVRFLIEEVCEGETKLVPTYGNTLMGLAAHKPLTPEDNYSITYHAPQPRAVLRVVNPDQTDQLVDYGQWGRVELTTLTRELFMPRFLERDEVIRRKPCEQYPWDGVGDVRPFGASKQTIVEGVY
ncbi:MAG: AMP-binding protein [Planctomycetes bacterium]|nr:AMP-binding protein [Planctomycetota bacterium]